MEGKPYGRMCEQSVVIYPVKKDSDEQANICGSRLEKED